MQYGKYFPSFSYFATYFATSQNMRNEENICQYCTRYRAITTLSLNACLNQGSSPPCLNQMNQELSYLLNGIELAGKYDLK